VEGPKKKVPHAVRVVALDTISPGMFPPVGQYVLQMTPTLTPAELRSLVNSYLEEIGAGDVAWVHYIKHRQTLDVLRAEFPELPPEPNRSPYKFRPGDVLIAAVLRRRPTRRNPCTPLSPDDFLYWLVTVKRKISVLAPGDAIPKL
jgi:hypothetical protein